MCSRLTFPLLALACLALAGCGTNKTCERTEPFQTSQPGGELRVPDDLPRPPVSRDYAIPEVAPGRTVRGPCADAPPGSVKTPPPPPDVKPPEPDADGNLPLPDSSAPPPLTSGTPPPPPPMAAPASGAADGSARGPEPVRSADGPPPALTGAAKTAGAMTPAAITGEPIADARVALDGWLAAWRAGDADTYLGYYSDQFEPPIPGEELAVWRRKRRDLLVEMGTVDVRLDRITIVESRPGVVRARFIQELHRDGQINAVIKSLEFGVHGERMQIDRELVLEVL